MRRIHSPTGVNTAKNITPRITGETTLPETLPKAWCDGLYFAHEDGEGQGGHSQQGAGPEHPAATSRPDP